MPVVPPAPTARVQPTEKLLASGQGVKITFSADPDVAIWEQDVTPPGIENGDPIDITHHFNTTWRTKALRKLKELTDTSFQAFYNTKCYTLLLALIGVEQTITILFPDGATLAFYGGLKTFAQSAHNEGNTAPKGTFTIVATNTDAAGLEAGPVYTPAGGGAAPMFNRKSRSRTRAVGSGRRAA